MKPAFGSGYTLGIFLGGIFLATLTISTQTVAAEIGYQAVPRDAFPVFDNPVMVSAAEAESTGLVSARDAVIGVAHNGEAKAYPVTVMGVHELGNDTIGGVPVTISW